MCSAPISSSSNPDTVRTFVAGVAKAIEWTQTQPRDEVIAEFEKIIDRAPRNEDTSAVEVLAEQRRRRPGRGDRRQGVQHLDRLAARARASSNGQRIDLSDALHQRVQPVRATGDPAQ